MAMILIGTYILFTGIPRLIYVVCHYTNSMSNALDLFTYLTGRLSHTCDAVVYIFVQKGVRDVLKKKIFCCKLNGNIENKGNMDNQKNKGIEINEPVLLSCICKTN